MKWIITDKGRGGSGEWLPLASQHPAWAEQVYIKVTQTLGDSAQGNGKLEHVARFSEVRYKIPEFLVECR